MILSVMCKNKIIYEEVRTVEIENNQICYYRKAYYTAEKHKINMQDVVKAHLQGDGGKIIWNYELPEVDI